MDKKFGLSWNVHETQSNTLYVLDDDYTNPKDWIILVRKNNQSIYLSKHKSKDRDTDKDIAYHVMNTKLTQQGIVINDTDVNRKKKYPNAFASSEFFVLNYDNLEKLLSIDNNLKSFFHKLDNIDDCFKDKSMLDNKNTILYGPPGTGKTYNTVVETMRIMKPKLIQYYEHNLKDENKDNQKRSDDGKIINYEFLKDKFDILKQQGRIEFVTFHQSYSYEEFVEGIKPVLNAEQIQYEKKKGVFKQICENASEKTESNFDDVYEKFINKVLEHYDASDEPYKLKTSKNKTFAISVNSNNNLSLLTGPSFKQTGTLTKHNLKHLSDWKYYATPIHKYLVDEFKLIENETVENRPYVLIIDEINRGNISKIFGELITLLEEDKRVGEKNEVTVRLPYSEPDEPAFGVPSNLYIIGTMNTSDRSIASVDIALRRRFKFKEMMPDSSLVPEKIGNLELRKIFKDLNKRIKILLDRDHQIGHSYFIDVDSIEKLKNVWFESIIPLLNEYFYGDWKKLQLIICDFIDEHDVPACLKEECDEKFYEFKTLEEHFKSDEDFITALNKIKIPEENDKNSTT